MEQRNWAGNFTYHANQWHTPQTVADLQSIIKKSDNVKGLGSRHSFNHIADTNEAMLSLVHMNDILEIDKQHQTVTVEGGISYGTLCQPLHIAGFALPNLASLPHISVVGACMTGTHGSGEQNGNLATAVSALEFVTADGEIVHMSRESHADVFAGMVVSLGALGVVTKITLDIVPMYEMCQEVYLDLPYEQVLANFDEIQASAYSVSLFTHWDSNGISQAWLKSKADTDLSLGDNFYGGKRATVPCSPVGDDRVARCTEQLGVHGAWYERLPHFRLEFAPSHGDEIQSEFFVPRTVATEAMQAILELHEDITPLLYISEIRTIKGDDLWLSPAYGRDSVAFHFTWKPLTDDVLRVTNKIESALSLLDVRPHWGKVFTMSRDRVQSQYERLSDFRNLIQMYDPTGKFHNAFLRDYIL